MGWLRQLNLAITPINNSNKNNFRPDADAGVVAVIGPVWYMPGSFYGTYWLRNCKSSIPVSDCLFGIESSGQAPYHSLMAFDPKALEAQLDRFLVKRPSLGKGVFIA